MTPVVAKVFECVLLSKCQQFLVTDNLQFGFKRYVGCPQAVFTLRSVITGRKAGIKLLLLAFFGSSSRRGDSVYRLSSNLAGRRRPPIVTVKVENFLRSFGEFWRRKPQNTA